MNRKILVFGIALAAGLLLAVASAKASVIPGVTYTISSNLGSVYAEDYNGGYLPNYPFAGTRLTDGVVGTATGASPWDEVNGSGQYVNDGWWNDTTYASGTFTGPTFTFNLGSAQPVSSILINYCGDASHPISSVTAAFSTDGATFGNAVTSTGFVSSTDANAQLVIPVSLGFNPRYVEMGFHTGGTTYRFVSEVGFTTPSPEPGTMVLLATGVIGLLAYAWRKRK